MRSDPICALVVGIISFCWSSCLAGFAAAASAPPQPRSRQEPHVKSLQWAMEWRRWKPRHSCRGGRPYPNEARPCFRKRIGTKMFAWVKIIKLCTPELAHRIIDLFS